MTVEVNLVQTTALALLLLVLGESVRARFAVLRRFAIPGPVIGGFFFALLTLVLHQTGVASLEFDTSLQTPAMVAFFTTVGLAGSFALLRKGGRLLIVYLVACWTLAIMQNLIGIGMAQVVGVDPLLGIMAGAVSLEGGHGAAAAFGPDAEAMGAQGANAVALAAATFGLIAGGLLGGPIAGWLIERRKIEIPKATAQVAAGRHQHVRGASLPASAGTRAIETVDEELGNFEDAEFEDAPEKGAFYRPLLNATVVIAVIMVLGTLLGEWFSGTTGFSLPAYVGAMVVAVAFRNINDLTKLVKLDDAALGLISKFTLGFFLTMAMMTLRIWDLASLALPLIILLVVQVIFIILFTLFVVFPLLGRNYDAATMAAGMLGHGLGGTPNAMANMDALNQRFGVRSERAFLIVPLAGAVLIDIVALPWIVFCMNWVG